MLTHSKNSTLSTLKMLPDLIWIGLGMLLGGIITLALIWLWLDYQANPSQSLLAWSSAQVAGFLPTLFRDFLEGQARLMGLPLTTQTSAYWYIVRAGGFVSYLLLWLSTVWGLTLSTKVVNDLIPAPIAYGLHEFLSLLALAFAGLHIFSLLGDSYINFNLFHLLIPFTAPYEPLWTGLGSLAFYLALMITASFYGRKQIGQKMWRMLHYLSFATYALALSHGLLAGSDSKLIAVKLMYVGSGLSILFLIYYRLLSLSAKPNRRS